jgi:hypothetical protein
VSPVSESLLWLTPSPLWQGAATGVDQPGFERPWLAEFETDEFIPDFLSRLTTTGANGPTSLGALAPHDGIGSGSQPFVLYQPLHGRFYLVVGSLVCKRVGLPDREVKPKGQRVSFVVRRLAGAGDEQAWVPARSRWENVAPGELLHDGEEQLPMHAAALGAPAGSDTMARLLNLDRPGVRTVYYGYVPVTKRTTKPEPLAEPLTALIQSTGYAPVGDDPRIMEFRLRVAGAWSDLVRRHAAPANADVRLPSLYVLLDLRDWMRTYLPGVLDALVAGTPLAAAPQAEALRKALDLKIRKNGAPYDLRLALTELDGYTPLVTDLDTRSPYDLSAVPAPAAGFADYFDELCGHGATVGGRVHAALQANEAAARVGTATMPAELRSLITAKPDPTDSKARPDVHVIRLVYEHEPCLPVLSRRSPIVRFASTYDPDAPARPIRIELPDPNHLRRFKKGVAMEMPPKLRELMDRVHPGMLDGDDLNSGGTWGLGMICSFSIQIIFMVAFVVMFIFLLLLNIVFWWMAFLKICFPIPTKKS